MMVGMLLGVLLYRPIFSEIYKEADTSSKTKGKVADNGAGGITYYFDGSKLKTTSATTENGIVEKKEVTLGIFSAGKITALIFVMVLFVTMVYGPIAAFLVELFPTKIRYTSMSLPYHIGNGVFGGMVPFIATLITTIQGTDHLSGLWYPIVIAGLSFVIGSMYLSNKIDKDVTD